MKKAVVTCIAAVALLLSVQQPVTAAKKHKKAVKTEDAVPSVPAEPNIAAVPPGAPAPERSLTPGSPELSLPSDSLRKHHKVEIVPAPPPGNLPTYIPEKH